MIMICLRIVAFIVLFSSECLCFWWSSLLENTTDIDQNYNQRFPRKTLCKLTALYIQQCEITISRLGNEKITVTYQKSCEIKDTKFVFYFGREGGYMMNFETNNPYITVDDMKRKLQKTFLEIGTHFILAKMQAFTMKNEPLSASSPQCHFYVRPENATAVLGALNRNAKEWSTIFVDASRSKNNDVGRMNVGLLYRWSCVDNVEFCQGRDLGTNSRVRIDKQYTPEGARFVFTVEVRTDQSYWQKAVQFINVNSSMPYTVSCIKNCGKEPNTWNPKISAWVFSECHFSCDTVRRQHVKGRLIDEGGGVLAEYGNIASSPVSIGDIKKPGKRYKIRIYHEKNHKEKLVGENDFYTYPLPKLENCKSIPSKGSPLTKFKLSCDYEKENANTFRLQIRTNNTVVYSINATILEDIEFVVSFQSEVLIIIEDINGVTNQQTVKVEVEPIHDQGGSVTNVADALFNVHGGQEGNNSVYHLIQEGQYETALQVIGIIAGAIYNLDVTDEKEKEAIRALKKELLTDLTGVPIETIDIAKSVSGIVGMLANPNADDASDPVMVKLLATICSEVAKRQLYLKQNDHSGKIDDQDIATIAKNLLKCADSGTTPNYDIFNQTDLVEIGVTTQYPIRENLSEQSFEDYPQYIADDIIEDQVQNFIDAGENVIDVCRDTSDSMLSTLNSQMKSPKYFHGLKSILSLMKSSGRLISMAEFKQHNATIVPGPYLKQLRSTLIMRVCSYEYNPFWSASMELRIPTSVLDVGIMKIADKKEIKNFGNLPMNISFELLKGATVKVKITQSEITSPPRYSEYKEDNFTIFMVEVKKGESFFIEFYNLTKNDKIDIAVANMKRPVLQSFADLVHADIRKPKIFIEVNEKDGDQWFLIGMKPNSTMGVKGSMKVWFSVFTPRCIRWESKTKSWKFACSVYVTTTHRTVHCKCFHLSTLAGFIEYNRLKEHQKFLKIEFELEMKGSLYIISFVVILYAFYFFLLMYSIRKSETLEDTVFFMADVPAYCRYAYLVVVKTGERLGSGTTSDIVIEIFGENGSSLKHVLNFPDPFFELLRRSAEDYLVLATKYHLGPLRRINLSFDCSGTSPNWYCHSVKICDLQTKRWYKFKVKKWLRFDGNSRLFMSVPVSEKEITEAKTRKKRFIRGVLKFGQLHHTMWHLMKRADDPNFGPVKRSTMMLSIVLTIMALSLKFYASPEFLPRDSITKYCYFRFHWEQLFIGLYSATIAFFPHLGLMTGFKKSRMQSQPKTSQTMLPVYCTYIFWTILIINVLIQTHILIIYGPRIIYPTTWEWTISWIIALIVYIFILEFFFLLLLEIFIRELQSTRVNFTKMLKNIEAQRKYLYKLFGKEIYRPILDPVYDFLAGARYLAKARRIYYRQRWDVTWQMQDLVMTILLMICFYLIVRGERDQVYDFLGHREVLSLLNGAENRRVKLNNVTQSADFFEYMEKTFIPTIQSYQWYGRYMSRNPGMISDTCNRYLGVVRLRQHRVEATCTVPKQMEFLKTKCYSSFYFCEYDFQNYTPHWKHAVSKIYSSRMGYVWGFQKDTGNTFFGETAYYPLGGYIAHLGRTINNSYINFNYLKRQNWLDHRTRAILIEFCIYNVNSNVFHFVEVLFERASTGYISSRIRVMTERVLKYGSKKNYLSLFCAVIFIIFVIIISVRIGIRIFKTRTWNKSHLWHLLDVAIVAFSYAFVVMHFKKLSLLQEFAKELEEKESNAFVDFFEMTKVVNSLNFLTSCLVTLTIVRLWKLLRFAAVFRVVERTLTLSFETLFIMFIIFSVYEIGFGFLSYVFLGSKLPDFKDWYSVLKVLINLLAQTQKSSTGDLGLNQRGLGYVFFVLYAIFCYILRTMFVAIIVYNYKKARRYAFEERTEYSMKDYTLERIRHLKRLTAMWIETFRLSAGGQEEHVHPKKPCSRYMNFVETDSNRMKAMASVTKCVLLKKLKGLRTDASDHIMMLKMVQQLLDKSPGEREIFFVEGNIISGYTFVDDRKMLKMERIVKSLLESPQQRAVRRRRTDLNEALKADNLAKMMQISYRLNLMLKTVRTIEIAIKKEDVSSQESI
ncbi:uncharacterized protein LOC123680196 [Harmonia axyridis]|uniref:uncharacterized protein LOC123680196 n=1 Tax=Harmonia axyridis TaxID=115357 RepID=UPI001E277B76|nr:uncharacterized protein LOC123680196 [Harmonia axyridis]